MAAFTESLGLRPLDVGGLEMAHWLEAAALVVMGLARHGAGHWDIALGLTKFRTAGRFDIHDSLLLNE